VVVWVHGSETHWTSKDKELLCKVILVLGCSAASKVIRMVFIMTRAVRGAREEFARLAASSSCTWAFPGEKTKLWTVGYAQDMWDCGTVGYAHLYFFASFFQRSMWLFNQNSLNFYFAMWELRLNLDLITLFSYSSSLYQKCTNT